MRENESPYTSPESELHVINTSGQHSNVPKVFGILHIIYASLGMIISAFTFVSYSLTKKLLAEHGPEVLSALDKVLIYNYIDASVKLVLGGVLLVSGIKLLKYSSSGLRLSNIWSASRVVWFILISIISYSANQAVVSMSELPSALKTIGVWNIVYGVIVIGIYPLVSYILLNKESVRQSLK